MVIAIYYVFSIFMTYIFTLLFNIDFTNLSNPLLYVLCLLAVVLGFVIAFIILILILYVFGLLRSKKGITNEFNHRFANSILRLGLHLMRTKVVVTGKDNIPVGNFILYANHQENYDILILKPIFNDHKLSFIAKEALTNLPLFGVWIKLLGNVFISRDADRSAAESIIKAIKQYKDGMSMGIFPEGKRAFGNELIDFKAGAFKLAMKPNADILIVTQYDVSKIFKKFPWKRYRCYVHIHPLLKYEEYKGLKSQEVSAIVKERIQNQLDVFKKTVK